MKEDRIVRVTIVNDIKSASSVYYGRVDDVICCERIQQNIIRHGCS